MVKIADSHMLPSKILKKGVSKVKLQDCIETLPSVSSNLISNIAMQTITLYFVRMNTFETDTMMEQSFLEHYASTQKIIHIRALWIIIVFIVSTVPYDYLVLGQQSNIYGGFPVQNKDRNSSTFMWVLGLRCAIILPIFFVILLSTRKVFQKTTKLAWLSNVIIGSFPIIYNIITEDFGVSWLCLFIMFVYSCTPIRFFPNAIFCGVLVSVYALVVFTVKHSVDFELIWNETLYVFLFYFLVSMPSQSREYAIRISFLSELLLSSQHDQLKQEEGRSKLLLKSMLPDSVVQQLKIGNHLIADQYKQVTVLFAEVCDFNDISSTLAPRQVVELLNALFSKFDKLVDDHGVHKVETIGAVYMVAGGCPDRIKNHAELTANLALEMLECLPDVLNEIRRYEWGHGLQTLDIRIGMNTGGLMAGVVGIKNPRFKLFGDTVNTASRMETTNHPGHIQLTKATYNLLKHSYEMVERGELRIKGKGKMTTYFLKNRMNTTPIKTQPIPMSISNQERNACDSFRPPMLSDLRISQPGLNSVKPNKGKSSGLKKPDDGSANKGVKDMVHNLVNNGISSSNLLIRSGKSRLSAVTYFDGQQNVDFRSALMKFIPRLPTNDHHDSNAPRKSKEASVLPLSEKLDAADSTSESTVDNFSPIKPDVIMRLPQWLKKRNVFFYIHGHNCFGHGNEPIEELYESDNRKRWLKFFRRSIFLFSVVKPFISMYQIYQLTSDRFFDQSDLIFLINYCFTVPLSTIYVLFTFSETFSNWEQVSSVAIVLILAVILNIESMLNSIGHGYLSCVALYQCHFSIIAFVLRFMNGFIILAMYLATNLSLVDYINIGINQNLDSMRVIRNALYIFIFFAAQAWTVFNYEFKQRINHFRELTLNQQQQKLMEEQDRVSKLLSNLLPKSIVNTLKLHPEATIAESFDSVTVLFTDMVHFTDFSSKITAMELVDFLNDMYTRFDSITEKREIYKVEIIGDAYFVVGGCPIVSDDHSIHVVLAALDMLEEIATLREKFNHPSLNIRIGIHTGPVVAGVVGIKDPRYHLFGETVTIAQNLECLGVPDRVHISETTYKCLNVETDAFEFEYHKMLSVNNNSTKIRTYFVNLK